jgi:hypothetical protein
MVEVYRGDTYVQAQTPGSWDAIVFERSDSVEYGSAGMLHSDSDSSGQRTSLR